MKNLNKFEENAIQKQDMAYKASFAKKQFAYSCELCCARNLRGGKGSCDSCPIKEAHINALTEIALGKREKPEKVGFTKYGASKFRSEKCRSITVVVRFD